MSTPSESADNATYRQERVPHDRPVEPPALPTDKDSRASELAAARALRVKDAAGDKGADVTLVDDTTGKPEHARDSRWKTMVPNESIESAASASQKWNPKDNPIPPIGQILASDSGDNPLMVQAIQDALKAQAGGDKTRLGDLIVKEIAASGGDAEAARRQVEKAFTEQKAMQYDFALQSLAGLAAPNGSGKASDGAFDALAKDNPDLAAQIKKWAESEAEGKSPFAMINDLKKFKTDLADVAQQVSSMITPEERQKFPNADRIVQERALSILLENPDPKKRAEAIEALRQDVIKSSPKN